MIQENLIEVANTTILTEVGRHLTVNKSKFAELLLKAFRSGGFMDNIHKTVYVNVEVLSYCQS